MLVGIEPTAIAASGTAGDPREELCELARKGLLSEYERVCDCVSRTCGGTGGGGGRYRRESESPPQDGRHRHAVKTSMRYDGPRCLSTSLHLLLSSRITWFYLYQVSSDLASFGFLKLRLSAANFSLFREV